MTTRRERVILDLESNLAAGLARDAVAARALSGELNRLGTSTDRVGTSSGKAGPEIDRFSGRLRLWADAALIVGPALAPLGASIIPVLTGSIAALGAASGGIGAAILAFNGLGDAMKAIDEAQADRSAENLQAMRVELEKLGPAGAQFAKYLQSIAPEMTQLQMVAREGMFPGMQEGIDDLLTRLPQVQEIISRLSRGVGDLAASAGADLASEEWQPFFDYVETTARPTLERFGNSVGNVAQGLADMLVAVAPASRDFTRGMEDMSLRFAEWAAGLKESEDFKDFLDYIRTSGPQALDLLSELGGAFVAIAEAAAPIGSAVLPALTSLVKIIGAIADTPLGSAFLTAAVAITAYNRAALVATATTTRLRAAMSGLSRGQVAAGIGLIALSMTDLEEKVGLSNTAMLGMAGLMAGPWGAAIGAGAGAVLDLKAANDDLADSIEKANDAAAHGTLKEQRTQYRQLKDGLDDFTFSMTDLLGMHGEEEAALAELRGSMRQTGGVADLFARDIGVTADQLKVAAGAAEAFTGAIERLNGWLDKREALRGYRDSIRQIGKGLKDGFGRKDVENIDNVGRSIIQVAESIKDKGLRADFLAGARASLEALANKAGPKARAEIRNLIDKMDELGLTHPKPKVDLDKKPFDKKARDVTKQFDILQAMSGGPTVTADTRPAQKSIRSLIAYMNDIPDENVGIHVTRDNLFGKPTADGGTINGPRYPYRDRIPALLAPGEEVISNRYGQADRHRTLLRAINANRMAGGGTAGFSATTRPWDLPDAAHAASGALALLRDRLREAERSLQKETAQRDRLRAKAAEVSSGITSGLTNDLWESSENVWAAGSAAMNPAAALADRKDRARRLIAAIRTLKRKGVSGAVLAEIIGTGDVERAEFMAKMTGGALADFASDYAQTQNLVAQTAQMGGALTFGNAADKLTPGIKDLTAEVKQLSKQLDRLSEKHKENGKKNSDDNAAQVAKGINKAARDGRRRSLV